MNEQVIDGQEGENLAGKVMDDLGMPTEDSAEMAETAPTASEVKEEDIPASVQKRLGKQAERHRKEMRMMQEQLYQLQNQLQQQPQATEHQPSESFTGQPEGGNVDDQISRAVAAAMRAKEEREAQLAKQREQQESQQHMQKQYQDMNSDFDKAAEKYEDFDDVVRHPDMPFTPVMRDYALTLPNRADVLYKLGKNPEELKRISKLPPIDQAREMYKLSVALMGGEPAKAGTQSKPMSQVKGTPVASHAVTEKTSVSDIRSRMKSGGWK